MKRVVLAGVAVLTMAGCATQGVESAASADQPLRLGAGDELGWRLRTGDRAITSVSAEERDLATHE